MCVLDSFILIFDTRYTHNHTPTPPFTILMSVYMYMCVCFFSVPEFKVTMKNTKHAFEVVKGV